MPTRPPLLDLRFDVVARFRRVALVAPGFAEVVEQDATRPAMADTAPVAPYTAVVLRGVHGDAVAGLGSERGDQVAVRWRRGRLALEVRTDGRPSVLRRSRVRARAPFDLAFVLCGTVVTAYVDTGHGWRPALRKDVRPHLDVRREEVLAGLRHLWHGTGTVEAGVFGMTGLRDPQLVRHADGRPFSRDGRVFLTWSCAGPGFFQQAHWSVWSLDPADPTDMRLESQLFFRRGGLVLGDHAGQLVRDGEEWLVLVSSWGDFAPGAIHVRHTTSAADLLSGVHLLETERTPLPTVHGSWDPSLTRVDGRWHLAFVESTSQRPFRFHPALASTGAERWHDGLALVAAETGRQECEGTLLTPVDGRTWLLASDRHERRYPVLALDGTLAGHLDAPYPTNIPHPALLEDPAGGWWMLTFDGRPWHPAAHGYGTHGDVVVMHSA